MRSSRCEDCLKSTAVRGLPAKPVIDLMPLVRNIDGVDPLGPAMAKAGYDAWGEYGMPGRRLFTKGGDEHRTHNVHIFQIGNLEATRHLDFRNYLRVHPEVARRYSSTSPACISVGAVQLLLAATHTANDTMDTARQTAALQGRFLAQIQEGIGEREITHVQG